MTALVMLVVIVMVIVMVLARVIKAASIVFSWWYGVALIWPIPYNPVPILFGPEGFVLFGAKMG
jgi:hypothetical protein